jgi:ATP-dependent RNA helicase DDX19/DBP5
MRKNDCHATLMFGDMGPEERDEMMAKFRKGEVRVFITTNMLARGIDVPEVEVVINFDVPVFRVGNERHGDP